VCGLRVLWPLAPGNAVPVGSGTPFDVRSARLARARLSAPGSLSYNEPYPTLGCYPSSLPCGSVRQNTETHAVFWSKDMLRVLRRIEIRLRPRIAYTRVCLQNDRGRKPRFGRERPRCLCGYAAQKCSPGSLPPKSPIGIRQGLFGGQKNRKSSFSLKCFSDFLPISISRGVLR